MSQNIQYTMMARGCVADLRGTISNYYSELKALQTALKTNESCTGLLRVCIDKLNTLEHMIQITKQALNKVEAIQVERYTDGSVGIEV